MTPEQIEILTAELFESFEDLNIRLGRIGKFGPEAVKEAYDIIVEAIRVIEDYSENVQQLTSEDKKAVAVKLMNEIIDIPWTPEFVEASLISWSIDLVVDVFNKVGGNKWLEMLFPPAEEE